MDIRYFVMDVDGTLTDGRIYMSADGEIMKAFDIKDGCGIHDILPRLGITPVIITGRSSRILENRCRELGITMLFQGVGNKVEKLLEIVSMDQLSSVAYVGDDINDLECMMLVREHGGFIGCPADAVDEVKACATYVSTRNGGAGAVRDCIERLAASGQ